MTENRSRQAAATLWALQCAGETINALPAHCNPRNETEGRKAQLYFAELANSSIAGWKIAATSAGGQNHIGVTAPLEGPYLESRIHSDGAVLSMAGNHMAVAEAEFAFRFGQSLDSRSEPYEVEEMLEAVDSLHPSLEFPDSRISEFATVGAATLLADCACGRDWVLGAATTADWATASLQMAPTRLIVNDEVVSEGTGEDALGNPLTALNWVVNQLRMRGITIESGQHITTGVCGLPKPIRSGDQVICDLGEFGSVSATLVD